MSWLGIRHPIRGLTPWKPGTSGNPGGRPKKKPISDRYEHFAEVELDEEVRLSLNLPKGKTFTYADAAAIMQFRAALQGDTAAIREIREAIEGKATTNVNLDPDQRGGGVIIPDWNKIFPPRKNAT